MLTDTISTGLSDVQISRIQQVISEFPNVKRAILFGSRAAGSHYYGSDIDIALDGDNISFEDLLKIHRMIDDLNLPFFTDIVHIQNIEDSDLLKNIQSDGIIIYSRD